MIHLPKSLLAWPSEQFNAALKSEIEHLDAGLLPLQQGLSQSSQVFGSEFSAMILGTNATAAHLHVKIGIFYSGIVAGCSCAGDPTQVDAVNEYCEMLIGIDRKTAEGTAVLVAE